MTTAREVQLALVEAFPESTMVESYVVEAAGDRIYVRPADDMPPAESSPIVKRAHAALEARGFHCFRSRTRVTVLHTPDTLGEPTFVCGRRTMNST